MPKGRMVELKETTIESGGTLSYRDQIIKLLETIPKSGLGVGEMESRLRIRKQAREAGESLLLDKEDYERLKSVVVGFSGWAIVDQAIVDFVDHVKNAEEVEMSLKE